MQTEIKCEWNDMKSSVFVIGAIMAAIALVGIGWTSRAWFSPLERLNEYQGDPNRQQDVDDFQRNYSLWKSKRILNYRLVQTGDCWTCPSPQTTEVFEGKLSGMYLIHKQGQREQLAESHLKTIDDLFAEINRAIEAGADGISVEYAPKLGYPVKAIINYKNGVSDDECSHQISELQIIQ
jgi:Family of unknown function (DUF6174)